MSQQQLDVIIQDIQACFGAWDETTTLDRMRRDWDAIFSAAKCPVGARVEPVKCGTVPAERVAASNAAADRAVLYIHGGGFTFGSPTSHRDLAEFLSRAAQAQVFVVDYRLAPEHPFPAAVEDTTAAYRWLLAQGFQPGRIAISGDSAGGGLTFSTLVNIKQTGLPLPACATPLSPWVDLENTGETMVSKDAEDPIVHKPMVEQLSLGYAGDRRRDPLASPLHADLSGLPPLLIQVGSRETLLDDSRRIAAKAKQQGVDVTLEIEEGQIHVFQIFASRLDEGVTAIDRLGAFIRRHTG